MIEHYEKYLRNNLQPKKDPPLSWTLGILQIMKENPSFTLDDAVTQTLELPNNQEHHETIRRAAKFLQSHAQQLDLQV